MTTLLIILAFLTPSILVVAACMLSSRLSKDEAFVEHFDTTDQTQDMPLSSIASRS